MEKHQDTRTKELLEQLRKDYNIRGYPTIVDLDGGKQVGEYSGERSVDALKNHALNM